MCMLLKTAGWIVAHRTLANLIHARQHKTKCQSQEPYALCSAALSLEMPVYSAAMISFSLMNNRARGDKSIVPSLPIGVCSPPVPRTLNPSGPQMALQVGELPCGSACPSAVNFGTLTWTDARMPVPRFDGHDVMYPYLSERANLIPSIFSTVSSMVFRRLNTSSNRVPFFMHMMRR